MTAAGRLGIRRELAVHAGRTAEEWIVEPDAAGMRSFRRAVFLGNRESIENCDEPVDLIDLIRPNIANLTQNIKANDAKLEAGPLPSVNGNAGALIHLRQNLLNNAMKYCSERSPEISVTADGARFAVWLPNRLESGGQAAIPRSRSA